MLPLKGTKPVLVGQSDGLVPADAGQAQLVADQSQGLQADFRSTGDDAIDPPPASIGQDRLRVGYAHQGRFVCQPMGGITGYVVHGDDVMPHQAGLAHDRGLEGSGPEDQQGLHSPVSLYPPRRITYCWGEEVVRRIRRMYWPRIPRENRMIPEYSETRITIVENPA